MDRFPPELHSYICSLACTDDGSTIRSLTLVSKYFSQITLPFLYQSISITGPSQIIYMAHKLSNTLAHHRAIYHLYLSDCPGTVDEVEFKPTGGPGPQNLLTQSILLILSLASPTLSTLTFTTTSPTTSTSLIASLFRNFTFPHLHSLTLSGHYPFPSSNSGLSSFPSLQHLHLNGNRNPYGLLQSGALESSMPNLGSLMISGLSLAVSFSQELRSAFEGEEEESNMFPAKFPPKLHHVLVRCASESSSSPPSTSPSTQLKDRKMIQNLENLQHWVRSVGHSIKFTLLPRGGSSDSSPEDLRKEWSDRLKGGQRGAEGKCHVVQLSL